MEPKFEHYPIAIEFRGQRITAQVHEFDTFYNVYFSDTEIVHSFGGQITVSADLKTISGRETNAIDEKQFHAAIVKGLKSVKD